MWLLSKWALNDVFGNRAGKRAWSVSNSSESFTHVLLFVWIKLIKAPFIPMSLIIWSHYMQNLSRQADETNNWGHLENSRELWLTQASRFVTRVTIFQKGFPCYAVSFMPKIRLKFLCQVLSSWIFLLFKFNQSGKCWDYYSRWIISASRSFHSPILVSCFCLSRTIGVTFLKKAY